MYKRKIMGLQREYESREDTIDGTVVRYDRVVARTKPVFEGGVEVVDLDEVEPSLPEQGTLRSTIPSLYGESQR